MTSRNSIQKNSVIKREALNPDDYLHSLAEEAVKSGVITEKEFKTLLESLFALLAEETKRFTKGKSSSVKTENARSIFDSLCYKISLYLKTIPDCERAARLMVSENASSMLSRGNKLLAGRLRTALSLYKKVKKNKLDITEENYNNLISRDIILFFKKYNRDFAAHDASALLELTYPLAIPVTRDDAVEYLIHFLSALYWENEFCALFPKYEIEKIINLINPDGGAYYNLFESVLFNALANVLLGRKGELLLFDYDISTLASRYGKLLPQELEKACDSFKDSIYGWDEFLSEYTKSCVRSSAHAITTAVSENYLSSFFTCPAIHIADNSLDLNDEQKMDNDEFRDLIDEIRACENMEGKLSLISSINSAIDLLDLLDSDCLYGSEYNVFFSRLSQNSLAILKSAADIKINGGEEHEWLDALYKYLND